MAKIMTTLWIEIQQTNLPALLASTNIQKRYLSKANV